MKFAKNKMTFAISLFLMIAMATSLIALPSANAQAMAEKKTFSYIGATPNPIGIGQETLLHLGITDVHPSGSGYGFENLHVIVTKPDNTTLTLGPFKTDSTGGTGTVYVPEAVGTYYLQTQFPEQIIHVSAFDFFTMTMIDEERKYLASSSDKLALVVTAEPIEFYPNHPLPTEYWTRPVDSQLREWYTLAGSWLTSPENLYVPYNDGPESAHILWTKPLTTGGMAGGDLGLVGSGPTSVGMETGDAYEGKWSGSSGGSGWMSSAIIVAGKLYYQHTNNWPTPVVYHCVDLHTGEELWAKTFLDNQTIDFGQLFYFEGFNYQGTFAYLWVTTGGGGFFGPAAPEVWYAFDAFTGDWMYTMTDIPSGTNLYGPDGEIYRYNVNLQAGTLSLWNSTKVVMAGLTGSSAGSWGSNAHGLTLNATRGIEWTKPIQAQGLQGSVSKTYFNDRIIGGVLNNTNVNLWGISTKLGEEGKLLFSNTWAAPAYWSEGGVTVSGFGGGWMGWSQEDKVGVLWIKETREHYAFSLETGQYMWGPTEPQYYLDSLDDTGSDARAFAYGRFYSASVSGIVYCYNATTGERLWTYEVDDPYTEILWANNWWQKPVFITDGKIYTGHTEHSANQPLPRGTPFNCIDAITGELIWKADGMFRQTRWGGRAIIGDSVIATMDTYDQRVYAVGKGPSAITVAASPEVSVHGSSVLVKGMMTDISPGTEEYALTARFPDGVPAVSDNSMSDWMLYVYKQFSRPTDTVGVPVTIDVLDANGNYRNIGTTTSDADGFFSFDWQPDIEGRYTVIATFAGSESYYASHAKTAFVVDPAPQATPEPTQAPASLADQYLLPATGGIIAAVAAVGIAIIALMLRKK